jgi:hypothetical protein
VSKNRELRIFGPKRDKVTGGWRRLHNEELHNLYSSPNIIRVIKFRMRWTEHVAHMGEMRRAYKNLFRKPKGRHHFEDLSIDRKIILELILGK